MSQPKAHLTAAAELAQDALLRAAVAMRALMTADSDDLRQYMADMTVAR